MADVCYVYLVDVDESQTGNRRALDLDAKSIERLTKTSQGNQSDHSSDDLRAACQLPDRFSHQSGELLIDQFRKSRWFSRGWTLQELIVLKQ